MTDVIAAGSALPPATLNDPAGEAVALDRYAGRPLVLFFYPKADTPGCTTEAQEFSALLPRYTAAGAAVVGVSKDAPAKLARFAAKHGLAVDLLSDADGDFTDRLGVWKEKAMYGKTYMGIERTTLLVAADGTVARVWPKVMVKGHAAEVLAAVEAL
jgi:peroxiredoxin Q/BCP